MRTTPHLGCECLGEWTSYLRTDSRYKPQISHSQSVPLTKKSAPTIDSHLPIAPICFLLSNSTTTPINYCPEHHSDLFVSLSSRRDVLCFTNQTQKELYKQ